MIEHICNCTLYFVIVLVVNVLDLSFSLLILLQAFVKKHGKKYIDKNEYKRRYKVFRQNMKKVQFLRETEKGTGEYGVTEFSDLTEEEYRKNKLGLKQVKMGHCLDSVLVKHLPDLESSLHHGLEKGKSESCHNSPIFDEYQTQFA